MKKAFRHLFEMEYRQGCDNYLTDAEWQYLKPYIPAPKLGGRRPKHSRREIVNGICYAIRSGGAWEFIPRMDRKSDLVETA